MTPVDELTRLPLLVMPTNDDTLHLLHRPGLNTRRRAEGRYFVDDNHAHHPRNLPELTSPHGRAVRDSVVQTMMRRTHDYYHNAFAGPELPQTTGQRLQTVIFALGRYVPRLAIDLRGTSPQEAGLTDAQVRRLQFSGEVKPAGIGYIRDFLLDCVVEQPMAEYLPGGLVDEFLSTPADDPEGQEWRDLLTEEMMPQLIEPLVEPFDFIHRQGVRQGLWPTALYRHPRNVVHDVLRGGEYYPRQQNLQLIGGIVFDNLFQEAYGVAA